MLENGIVKWHVVSIGNNGTLLGISVNNMEEINALAANNGVAYFSSNGNKYVQASGASYGASYAAGDIIGVALDQDNHTVNFYKNNVAQGALTIPTDSHAFSVANSGTASVVVTNFGQDSSFAGNKTAQGNQDGNEIGDFYYEPPSGFLALCTKNLPDVDAVPSEHFNTVLYSGNSSTNAITGVGFQPDFTWFKARSDARSHSLVDSVRGFNGSSARVIQSASTNAEWESAYINSLDSDGFTLSGSENYINNSSHTYVAWNWKANGSGSSNTDGDITSTVSVNTDAGFSVVSYTGTGSAATVGHGLSKKPEMILVKRRDDVAGWRVFHDANAANYHLVLETTAARASSSSIFNNTEPTASLFTVGAGGSVNASSGTFIAYCFHSVDGYSKVGSYTGNADADGAFIYTGFRPAYVMIKPSSRTGHWMLANNKSSPSNVVDKVIITNQSAGEYTDPSADCKKDFLSNGFKIYTTDDNTNDDETYIYLAFAETPFKYANAR